MVLVTDIKTLKANLSGVQQNMAYVNWLGFLSDANQKYIVPAIGQELTKELSELTETTGIKAELKKQLQNAEAKYAYLIGIPQMMVVTGDNGIVSAQAKDNALISKWAYTELIGSVSVAADQVMEDALAFLDENIAEKNSDGSFVFKTYLESKFYESRAKLLIKNARDATNYFATINNSRILYLAMLPYFAVAETDYLLSAIDKKTLSYFKTNSNFTELEVEGIELAKRCLVHDAFCRALPFLSFSPEFRVITNMYGNIQREQLSDAKLSQAKAMCETNAERYYNQLKGLLNANASATVFKDYFGSSKYVAPKGSKVDNYLGKIDTTKNYIKL